MRGDDVGGSRLVKKLADAVGRLVVQRHRLDPVQSERQPGLHGAVTPYPRDGAARGAAGTRPAQQPVDRLIVAVDRAVPEDRAR